MRQTMQPLLWIMTGLLLILALAACQPAVPSPEPSEAPAETQAVSPTESTESYPGPLEQNAVAAQPNTLYPEAASGSEVSWPQAYGMLMNGEVSQVMQPNAEKFTLLLKDGRSLVAIQPAPGDVLAAIESCGATCTTIEVSE